MTPSLRRRRARCRKPRANAVAGAMAVALALGGPVQAGGPGAGSPAIVQGSLLLDGRPLGGVSVAFVELGSGVVRRATSSPEGTVAARLQPGEYVVTVDNGQGLVLGRGPRVLSLAAGEVASARLELVALASARPQEPPPTAAEADSAMIIDHEPVGCMVANQYPLIDASVEPLVRVARARVYFKAGSSPLWYYVEMTYVEGRFVAKLPRPQMKASPVSYYVEAFSTTLGSQKTAEHSAVVVPEGTDCALGVRIAPFGPPGAVTVFSAATGASVAAPGFAAGGLALTAGTIALVAGGAAAAGITAAVPIFNPRPEPTQTPTPVPTARPTPRPTPIPTPEPTPSPTSDETPPPPITPFR